MKGVDTLTPKQELFARAYVELGNGALAYRRVYNVGPDTLASTVWSDSGSALQNPRIRGRIEELKALVRNDSEVYLQQLFRRWWLIGTADPNEIVSVRTQCCRHCYGIDFNYQWINESEWLAATIKALDKRASPPLNNGGYGFIGTLDPTLACPWCYGKGHSIVELGDTTKLSESGKLLYAGAKMTRYGEIEVQMHDQQKALEQVARMMGAFKDSLDLRNPPLATVAELPAGLPAEEASRRYLKAVG